MPFEDRLAELTPEQRELFELFLNKERLNLSAANSYRAPSNATEEALTAIWSELLGVDPGVDDNYFELGGDSITIIRMVAQARASGIALKTEWVFSHPTIARLAAVSRLQQPAATLPSRVRESEDYAARVKGADPSFDRLLKRTGAKVVDAYPLSPSQQGILYHAVANASEGSYVARWRFRLKGHLNLERFERAWASAIERHEAFRTVFLWVGVDEPLQVVLDRADAVVTVEDARAADWRTRAAEIFDEEGRTAFDLRHAPLMRVRFLRIGEDEWLCCWTHHHLILDGWSQQIFLKEFFAAYRGLPLPAPASGLLRDYVSWQRSLDETSVADFWRQELAGYRSTPSRVPQKMASGHAVSTRVVERAGPLRDALRREAVTLSAVYQTAWALALAGLSGRADVVFGVACSGRSSGVPGIENAVGLFINTLPLRVQIDPSATLAALVKTVQQKQAQLTGHDWCGLLAIQSWIGWDKRVPLVDSIYVYERFPLNVAELEDAEQLAVRDVETTTHEHYPLVLVVQDEAGATRLSLKHSASTDEAARRFDRLLDFVVSTAERFASTPALVVRDLLADLTSAHAAPTFANPILR